MRTSYWAQIPSDKGLFINDLILDPFHPRHVYNKKLWYYRQKSLNPTSFMAEPEVKRLILLLTFSLKDFFR